MALFSSMMLLDIFIWLDKALLELLAEEKAIGC